VRFTGSKNVGYSILAWNVQNRVCFWGSVSDPAGELTTLPRPSKVVRGLLAFGNRSFAPSAPIRRVIPFSPPNKIPASLAPKHKILVPLLKKCPHPTCYLSYGYHINRSMKSKHEMSTSSHPTYYLLHLRENTFHRSVKWLKKVIRIQKFRLEIQVGNLAGKIKYSG